MKVTACVCINDEDLVVEGDVTLPHVLDLHARDRSDIEITKAHTDDPERLHIERCMADWDDKDFTAAEDALFEAACDEATRR